MQSLGVEVFSPSFDDDMSLSQRVEQITVQQLVPESGVEAFRIAVLPRATRFDDCGLRTDSCDPISNCFRNELWVVVASDICRRPSQNEEIGQNIDDVGRVQLPLHPDRQVFPAEPIEDVQGAERLTVVSAVNLRMIGRVSRYLRA